MDFLEIRDQEFDHPELKETRTNTKGEVIWPKPWMLECRMEMVTIKTLPRVIDECISAGLVALDVEGTGLDTRVFDGKTVDSIVGLCIAPDEKVGYYIPFGHEVGVEHNIPRSILEPELERMFNAGVKVVFHFGQFDQEMLEFNGGKPWGDYDKISTWEDTAILAYLLNSRRKRLGLKSLTRPEIITSTDGDKSWEKYPQPPKVVGKKIVKSEKKGAEDEIHYLIDVNSDIGLDLPMVELSDIFPDNATHRNFATRYPDAPGTRYYACSDAICTLRLYNRVRPQVLEGDRPQTTVYNIEKACVAATRWMIRNQVKIDLDRAKELVRTANRDLIQKLVEVYDETKGPLGRDARPGWFKWSLVNFDPNTSTEPFSEFKGEAVILSQANYPDPPGSVIKGSDKFPLVYDIFSPQQLGQLMLELGVPGLKRTEKSKQIATSSDALDAIIEEHAAEFPWLGKIGMVRTLTKALGTYLLPMVKYTPERTQRVTLLFKQQGTDSGRFSTPKDDNRVRMGIPGIAIQTLPNTYNDPKNPRPESLSRLRECIVAEEDWFIVSIDLSGEELRIVTNISREPKWLLAFFQCGDCGRVWDMGPSEQWPPCPPPDRCECGGKTGDLHSVTADGLYPGAKGNVDHDTWAVYRGHGKIINFALVYGGGGNAVVLTVGVEREEADRMATRFKETYDGLVRWWGKTHDFARKHGYVLSAFGRKYPVPDINLPPKFEGEGKGRRARDSNSFWRSKAERNASNGPVQSTGSDIIKIAMGLIYRRVKKEGWEGKVRMIITAHDELDFEVHGSILHEFIPVAVDIMTNNVLIRSKKWPVPFTSDVELGFSWAVKWDWNKCARTGKWPDELKKWLPDGGSGILPVNEVIYQGQKLGIAQPGNKVPSEPSNPVITNPVITLNPEQSLPSPTSLQDRDTDAVFMYRIPRALTKEVAQAVAEAIYHSMGKGTRRLSIQTQEGEELKAWKLSAQAEDLRVSVTHFMDAIRERGL